MTPEERARKVIFLAESRGWARLEEDLADALRAAVAQERAECAGLAFNWQPEVWTPGMDIAAGIRDAIRARGKP